MTGRLPLPRSLDPLPDESIVGYVLRLARRLETSPARLVVATGLVCPPTGSRYRAAARTGLLVDGEPAARHRFAHATRLTHAETEALFLAAYAPRYPAARPRPQPSGRRGVKRHLDGWLLTNYSRYCPRCLAPPDSTASWPHAGSWRRAWRLPVVFACPVHRCYLNHQCSSGHLAHHKENGALPRWSDETLHPSQCRATISPIRRDQAAGCGVWLTGAVTAVTPPPATLRLQQRIRDALDTTRPDNVVVLGQRTTAIQYFTDLIQLSYLIRCSWPLAHDLVPTIELADVLERHLTAAPHHPTDRSGSEHRTPTIDDHRSPPANAIACAALLATADRLLTLAHPRELTGHLRGLLTHDSRRPARADWSRQFLEERPNSSEGLRQAIAPALQTYARPRRARGLRVPIRRTPFGPEHIAQFLQPDWFMRFLAHFDDVNPVHLRRTAALHLCQTTAGGSIGQAAARLGLPDTAAARSRCYSSVKAVHAWARQRSDPHEFEAAIHDLADHIEAASSRIDYHQRRTALRDWCIDPATWRQLTQQLPPPEWIHGREPELGDRKRQSASIIVWSRLTGSEHLFAPHPIRDRQPPHLHNAWRLSAYAMVARFRDGCTRPHDIALDRLLVDYATQLAAEIDSRDHRQANLAVPHNTPAGP
ncbi:TniQ family protein [Micromonospora tulbaghiae]|uniref:TniQ family protein n=1 Tax=Micromonospora TaxID=1873 RepID=UPI0036CFE3CF